MVVWLRSGDNVRERIEIWGVDVGCVVGGISVGMPPGIGRWGTGGVDHGPFTGPATIFGPMRHGDLEGSRHLVELFAVLLADDMHGAFVAGAGFFSVPSNRRSGSGRRLLLRSARALPRLLLLVALTGLVRVSLSFGVHRGESLGEIVQGQLPLVRRR